MSQDNNFSQGPVPQSTRKRVSALTFVTLGLTFFSANMWTDSTLETGPSHHDSFLTVLIGNFLPGICTSFPGCIDAKASPTAHLLAHFSFGIKGSQLPSLLLGGTQVGWLGVGMAMFTIPVGKATGLDINLLIAASGLLMTVTVFFDISALTVLSVIAVPTVTCLGDYSMWLVVNGMGGLNALKAVVPAQPLDLNVALALVMGSPISTGTLTADFVRFGRNAKLTVLVAMVAFFLGNLLMFIFGAAGAVALGTADISDVMIAQGLLLLAIVMLGLNIWTTNDNVLCTSGLGFANITGISSKTFSVINNIIGAVRALWLYNNFVGWSIFLPVAIPPAGDVIIADYLMNHRRYEHFATTHTMSINWAVVLAVALGVAAGHWLPGIIPVNAILGGALSYLILNPILNHKTTAAMTHVETSSVE